MEADALSRIDWEKGDETIQADSIQAIATAAIKGQGNYYIEAIPCSPQTIESLFPSIPDNAQIVCKAIRTSEIKSNSGDFSLLDPSLNLQCMTMWIGWEFRLKTKLLVISFKNTKPRDCIKVKTLVVQR